MKINGKLITDAKKKVVLHITRSDVKRGANKNPGACAAALACKRRLHSPDVRVHLGRTYVRHGAGWLRFLTGAALRTEIISFDRGGGFEPGDYTIFPVQPSHRSGKQQGSNKRTHKRRYIAQRRIVAGVRPHGANR